MAEIHQVGEQVSVNTVLFILQIIAQMENVSNPDQLFWQDLEKKIEETRQRFKNEFLQGNSYSE